MHPLLKFISPKTGVRAGLLQCGAMTLGQIAAMLDALGLDGATPWGELTDDARAEIDARVRAQAQTDAAQSAPTTPGAPATESSEAPASVWAPWLERVRAMLHLYALHHRPTEWNVQHPDQALRASLARLLGTTPAASADPSALQRLRAALAAPPLLDAENPRAMRYVETVYAFGLTPLEEDALWLWMAPALDPEFQWLLDALTRRPSEGAASARFVAQALGVVHGDAAQTEITACLMEQATLHHCALIEPGPLPDTYRAAPRLLNALLCEDGAQLPQHLSALLKVEGEGAGIGPKDILASMGAQVPARMRALMRARPCRAIVVGPQRAGARAIARLVADARNLKVVSIDLDALLDQPAQTWHRILREVRLQRAVLFIHNTAVLDTERHTPLDIARLLGVLARERAALIFEASAELSSGVLLELVERLKLTVVSIEIPDAATRERLWTQVLDDDDATARLARSVRTYPFGVDQIEDAARLGQVYANQEAQRRDATSREDALHKACQAMLTHRLGEMAVRVRVLHTWDDLVMSAEMKEQIHTLLNFGRLATKVLDEWGYGKRLSYGKGLSAMFSGSSGTGKTMVAGLVAQELGMDLYRIDLSKLVSKYIGETEQRLNVLFEEARNARCALLFDEADSMFGKRTEVKSSNDRYANLEVNYLLQKLEEHTGVVLLTTNFPKSIDPAFLRRLRFRIHFPKPDASLRANLWRRMIPPEAPQARNLGLKVIGERYELSGGEIRNAVLRAALFAAAEGRPLARQDLERSARAEYRQLGRLLRD